MSKYSILFLVALISGCVESQFYLAEESRLPRAMKIPEGKNRNDFDITLSYYVYPSGREGVFKLTEKGGWFASDKIAFKLDGLEPIQFDGANDGRPSYEVIRHNGVVDVVEHRKKDDVIFMTDDAIIWNKLGL